MKKSFCILLASAMLCLSLCACGGNTPEPQSDPAPTTVVETVTTTAYAARDAWVDASELIVRSGPGTEYEHIDGLVKDQQVTVIGHTGDWFQIAYYDDSTGYVSAAYLRFTADPTVPPTRRPGRTTATRLTTAATTAAPTTAPTAATATATAAPTN